MTQIYHDKENQVAFALAGKNAVGSTAPKTPFAKKAGSARTPFGAKANENTVITFQPNKGALEKGGAKTPFKTPNEKRVPLGGKDTNARSKIAPMQDWGLKNAKSTVKSNSAGRSRRARQATPRKEVASAPVESLSMPETELPEIEYMPPRATESPFVPADYEPIDYTALRSAVTDPELIADYLYPRGKDGKTAVARKMEELSRPPRQEVLADLDLPVGEDGLHDFERPLDLESDFEGLSLDLDEELNFDDDLDFDEFK
ncbi:hypothetical protein BZA70DRAFT_276967 [Myxozyma melibiosi]|uniref:Securin n=1 Tax=Myxozyma melibiosi TaxID=54550 RepID=A0ABR1F7L0_9ASCO